MFNGSFNWLACNLLSILERNLEFYAKDNLHFIVELNVTHHMLAGWPVLQWLLSLASVSLTGLLGPLPVQISGTEVVNPCSRAPHTVATDSHLSLDDIPQSFAQFCKIRTMVHAGQDDGAWAAGEVQPGLRSGMCSSCYEQLLWCVRLLHFAAATHLLRCVSLGCGINGTT